MQKPIFLGLLLLIAMSLTACNLGANSQENPTEVLEQPTSVTATSTRTVPTALATFTSMPTQQSNPQVPSNNNNNPACSPRTDWATYTVVAGDTLSWIAVRGNTNINALVSANCLANANVIVPGQVLRVPNAVTAATPIIVTSTSLPPNNNACRITMTAQHFAYYDQTYMNTTQVLNSGETYLITGHNFWNYRIQLNNNQTGWLQKGIPEAPVGNCGVIPELPLSYEQSGTTHNDICYFIPHGTDFAAYDDMAQSTSYFTLSGHEYYLVDARATNVYRVVSGTNLPYPAWVSSNSGGTEGNCTSIPDFSVSTTLNGASATFSPNDYPMAFEYPANWILIPLGDGMGGYLLGTMPRFNSYPGAKGLPSDIVGVNIMALETSRWSTAQAYAEGTVAEIRANATRIGVIQDPAAFSFQSGIETYHYVLSWQAVTIEQYIFQLDGRLFMLSIEGNQSHAARIVQSIRAR